MIAVHIEGSGIYETIRMPAAPRKGDVLWLGSLTLGASQVEEAVVSEVAWAKDNANYMHDKENEGVHVWVKVRRRTPK